MKERASPTAGHGRSGTSASDPVARSEPQSEWSGAAEHAGLPGDEERHDKEEIEALARDRRIGLSHAKAERFYQRYPDSVFIAHVERLTGYHRRPRGPGS